MDIVKDQYIGIFVFDLRRNFSCENLMKNGLLVGHRT